LRAISDADLQAIYRRKYWDVVRGDDLPDGIDLVAFDAAVNSGPTRGAKWLQQGLGVAVDGAIGPATITRARQVSAKSAIEAALIARMTFLRSLKTWQTFGKGWTRRVDDVRRVALAMADDAPTYTADPGHTPTANPLGPLSRLLAALLGMFARKQ